MSNDNWYPGHINKAKRSIKTLLKQTNSVIVVLDARAPYSSMAFEEFSTLKEKSKVLLLLNKADLADDIKTEEWKYFFQTKGFEALDFSIKRPIKKRFLIDKIKVSGRITRTVVIGIPNVGKSTILNYLIGKKAAKTANKAGVTRGVQWIHLNEMMLLLDTPGILFSNISNDDLFVKLFYIKAINVDKIDIVEYSYKLINFLQIHYPNNLKILFDYKGDPAQFLEQLCLNRRFFLKKGYPDLRRGAFYVFNLVTNGKIGKITYESVKDEYVK